jgi:hypothetical protein
MKKYRCFAINPQYIDLLAVIHKAVIDRIYRFVRESLSMKFKRKDLRPGSASLIQRCGSLLNPGFASSFGRSRPRIS